jgi:hypothetical protein
LTQLLQYVSDQKIPEVARIKEFIPTIEKRAKISLNDYLGKQPLTSPLQTETNSVYNYYGELNAKGLAHGRGIHILKNGNIAIGYCEDGDWSTGNYITIDSDGEFRVGELYFKDGRRWRRGTQYNKDGTE